MYNTYTAHYLYVAKPIQIANILVIFSITSDYCEGEKKPIKLGQIRMRGCVCYVVFITSKHVPLFN